jgi:hypothetical protein
LHQLTPGGVLAVVVPRCQHAGCDQQGHQDSDQDDQVNATKRYRHANTLGLVAMIPLRSSMCEA